jgi:programmed cell death protein 5
MDQNDDNEQDNARALYERRVQQMQQEMRKKEVLRTLLSSEAYERMMNVRLSNPELYDKVVSSLLYLAQQGKKLDGKITDEQLRGLLSKMTESRETTIEFRSK